MTASDAFTVTFATPLTTLTVSYTCVPFATQFAANCPPPPIVGSAPWSARLVAAAALSRFARTLVFAPSPEKLTTVDGRVPDVKYAELYASRRTGADALLYTAYVPMAVAVVEASSAARVTPSVPRNSEAKYAP